MSLRDAIAAFDRAEAGAWMHARVREWYPICRSITGDGVRQTLRGIGEYLPLEFHEIPSGAPLLDWTAPDEWNIRDAYIADAEGTRVVDFRAHSLHVMSYSTPLRARMTRAELAPHVFTLPDQPDLIPYRTSYYAPRWGFCLSQRQWDAMPEGEYEVCIDSTLAPGSLTFAECVLKGQSDDEVLISSHVCHPSLANDNLSGIAVAMQLARVLQAIPHRYSYRFVFAPGTIGAIAWLARNEAVTARIKAGVILACVGDPAPPSYKQSRRGNAEIDRAAAHVLQQRGVLDRVKPFSPLGYDERQYCSPGFNLPVGCFMRSGPGGFPEYHTSGDNPSLVTPAALADSAAALLDIIAILEGNARYVNQSPKCEPMLGRRGLYSSIGGRHDTKALEAALLWVLNYSDGGNDLLGIAERAELPFAQVREAADALIKADLLREA